MHGRTLSRGLHRRRRVQTRLVEIAYADVGEKHQHVDLSYNSFMLSLALSQAMNSAVGCAMLKKVVGVSIHALLVKTFINF